MKQFKKELIKFSMWRDEHKYITKNIELMRYYIEQAELYLQWRNSKTEKTCNDCFYKENDLMFCLLRKCKKLF